MTNNKAKTLICRKKRNSSTPIFISFNPRQEENNIERDISHYDVLIFGGGGGGDDGRGPFVCFGAKYRKSQGVNKVN